MSHGSRWRAAALRACDGAISLEPLPNPWTLGCPIQGAATNVLSFTIEPGETINLSGDQSIGWDDYSGPLQFVAQ